MTITLILLISWIASIIISCVCVSYIDDVAFDEENVSCILIFGPLFTIAAILDTITEYKRKSAIKKEKQEEALRRELEENAHLIKDFDNFLDNDK